MKTRLELPDPEVKIAVLLVEPVSSSRVGVPPVVTTVTASDLGGHWIKFTPSGGISYSQSVRIYQKKSKLLTGEENLQKNR